MMLAIGMFLGGIAIGGLVSWVVIRLAMSARRHEMAQDVSAELGRINMLLGVLRCAYRVVVTRDDIGIELGLREVAGDGTRSIQVH